MGIVEKVWLVSLKLSAVLELLDNSLTTIMSIFNLHVLHRASIVSKSFIIPSDTIIKITEG